MDQTYPRIYVERTLALVKPDAVHKAEEIEDHILKSGFIILQVGQNVLKIQRQKQQVWLNFWHYQ